MVHIPDNVYGCVCCILRNKLRTLPHRFYTLPSHVRYLNSSIERQHNKYSHIADLAKYISPSFLHRLLVCIRLRNGYKLRRMLSKRRCNFSIHDVPLNIYFSFTIRTREKRRCFIKFDFSKSRLCEEERRSNLQPMKYRPTFEYRLKLRWGKGTDRLLRYARK